MLMHCNHTAKDIVKLLVRPGSPIILVFDPSADTQFQEGPFSGGAKYTGWEICATKIAIYLRNDTR